MFWPNHRAYNGRCISLWSGAELERWPWSWATKISVSSAVQWCHVLFQRSVGRTLASPQFSGTVPPKTRHIECSMLGIGFPWFSQHIGFYYIKWYKMIYDIKSWCFLTFSVWNSRCPCWASRHVTGRSCHRTEGGTRSRSGDGRASGVCWVHPEETVRDSDFSGFKTWKTHRTYHLNINLCSSNPFILQKH